MYVPHSTQTVWWQNKNYIFEYVFHGSTYWEYQTHFSVLVLFRVLVYEWFASSASMQIGKL